MLKILFVFSFTLSASALVENFHELSYKTNFGNCPSKTSGSAALEILEVFRKDKSLLQTKKYIEKNKLREKYYLKTYDIEFNPVTQKVALSFTCPIPIARVQVFKKDGTQQFHSVLSINGLRIDPNYENVLRNEKKITRDLPVVSMEYSELTEQKLKDITRLLKNIDEKLRNKISDVVFDSDQKLVFVMTNHNHAISAFLGKSDWKNKSAKLLKTIEYFDRKKKHPKFVKFLNSQKVVVNFSSHL